MATSGYPSAAADCNTVDETTPMPLAQAMRAWCRLRNAGDPPHVNTPTRWVVVGIRGVHLRAIRVGKAWKTTIQWLDDFQTAVNGAHAPVAGREEAAAAAAAELGEVTKPRRRRTAAAS
jgi:hypothetical protein